MIAIRADRVCKSYRRYGRKRSVGSLKSALLSGIGARALSADRVFPALTDVSFEVAAGETIGVIGENGSGKSTLLKLLARILTPSSGIVETRGRVSALIELGAGFHPEISARENIEINGMLLGLSKKEVASRMDSILAFAGVGDFLDAPVKTFSSGMVVRLGFAVAAHSDPDVLLVDEVLAVGDEEFAHRCLEKIAEFQKQGRTIAVVSHDLDLIATRCRRVLRFSGGRLVADGPPAEVVGKYREEVADREGRARLLPRRPGVERAVGIGGSNHRRSTAARAGRVAGRRPARRGAVPRRVHGPGAGRGRGLRRRRPDLEDRRDRRLRFQHSDRPLRGGRRRGSVHGLAPFRIGRPRGRRVQPRRRRAPARRRPL